MTACQGLNSKWNEVLLSVTKVPDEHMLANLYMKEFHMSGDLKLLMALYLQDTVQKGEPASYSRLKRKGSQSSGAENKGHELQCPQ